MAAQLILAGVIVVAIAVAIAILLGVLVVRHRATTSRAVSPDEWLLVAPEDPAARDAAGRTDPVTSSSFRQLNESELAYRMRTGRRTSPGGSQVPSAIPPPAGATRPAARPPALAQQPPAARRTHRRVTVFVGATVALVAAAVAVAIPAWTGSVLDATGLPTIDTAIEGETPGTVDGASGGIGQPGATDTASNSGTPHATPPRTAAGGGAGVGGGDTTGGSGGADVSGGGGSGATPDATPGPTARVTDPPTPDPTAPPTPARTPDPTPTRPPDATPTPTPRPTPTPTPTPAPTPTPPPAADPPRADFDWTANGLSVRFANRTKHAVSWTWDFGDGATSTARNPTHVYDDGGTYTVKLTAISDSGGSAAASAPVTVQP